MSSRGCVLVPGLMGVARLLRSQMKISDSLAPEARRLGWKGLMSRERTVPVCWLMLATVQSDEDLQSQTK